MSKLHFCLNGKCVTEQVLQYQESHDTADYLPIQLYYDNYKEHWYKQIEDYMDRATFNAEFDYKLVRAVDSFREETAKRIAKQKGYGSLAAFNGWFYKILLNWKSNVKTASFRLKKRPAIQCPICGRFVGRIDQNHLQHYKSVSDLPKYFVYKGYIYETSALPKIYAVTWGVKTVKKWRELQKGKTKDFSYEKRRVRWPWRMKNGTRGVCCPYTRKVIECITDIYIKSLPDKFNRYALPMKWEDFTEQYPSTFIQSETYSLDRPTNASRGSDEVYLRDHIAKDTKLNQPGPGLNYEMICMNNIPIEFEYAFRVIEKMIDSEIDQRILKLIAAGYVLDDVASTLEMERKEVRRRVKTVRENKELELVLLEA